MARNEQNLQKTEEFIRSVLRKNFSQEVDPNHLREAAEKLCDAIPGKEAAA